MMNLFTLMTAVAETTASENTNEVATGAPATRLFGIIVLVLVLICVIVAAIYICARRAKPRATAEDYFDGMDKRRAESDPDDEDFYSEDDDADAEPIIPIIKMPIVPKNQQTTTAPSEETDDIASIFFGKNSESEAEAEITLEPSEAASSPISSSGDMCLGEIPADAKIKTESGSYTFYDYHKTQKGKLLVIPEGKSEFEVISMSDVIQIDSKELTTVKLNNGFLILSGSSVKFVDSLLAASKLSAKLIKSDVKLEVMPEGQLICAKASGDEALGSCLKEMHYHGGTPSIWYTDADGNPGAIQLSKITTAKIVSTTETVYLERVKDSDIIVFTGMNNLKLVNAVNGKIIAF